MSVRSRWGLSLLESRTGLRTGRLRTLGIRVEIIPPMPPVWWLGSPICLLLINFGNPWIKPPLVRPFAGRSRPSRRGSPSSCRTTGRRWGTWCAASTGRREPLWERTTTSRWTGTRRAWRSLWIGRTQPPHHPILSPTSKATRREYVIVLHKCNVVSD